MVLGSYGKTSYRRMSKICIFTEEVQDSTPNMFTNKHYNSCFQQLRDTFLPSLINNSYDNYLFLNQVKGKFQDVA